MLVLSRKASEEIRIGDEIVVTVVRVSVAIKFDWGSLPLPMSRFCDKNSSKHPRQAQGNSEAA